MTTITIERALLEQIIEKFAACGCEVCTLQSINAIRAALSAPATAPNDQLLKDAERYRWLRKTTNWVSSKGERIDVRNQPELWDESIDAAINATLKETP